MYLHPQLLLTLDGVIALKFVHLPGSDGKQNVVFPSFISSVRAFERFEVEGLEGL